MPHVYPSLNSDSEDGSIGLPGDADDPVDDSVENVKTWELNGMRVPPTIPPRQKGPLGFEILGFQNQNAEAGNGVGVAGIVSPGGTGTRATAAAASAPAPKRAKMPKGLEARLSVKSKKRSSSGAEGGGGGGGGGSGASTRKKERKRRQPPPPPPRAPPSPAADSDDDDNGSVGGGGGAARGTDNDIGPAPAPAPGAIGVNVGIGAPGADDAAAAAPPSPPAPLDEAQQEAMSGIVALFGEGAARGLRSHRWVHRADAIAVVRARLGESSSSAMLKRHVMSVVGEHVLRPCLDDSVFQVFAAAASLVAYVLTDYCGGLDAATVRDYYTHFEVFATLIARLGASNGRVRDVAKEALLTMAAHPLVGVQTITRHCLANYQQHSTLASYKLLIGKLSLFLSLLHVHTLVDLDNDDARKRRERGGGGGGGTGNGSGGGSTGGDVPITYTVDNAMQLTVFALGIVNPQIRRLSITLVVELYKRLGPRCEQYLRHLPGPLLMTLKQEIEVEVCDVEAFGAPDLIQQEADDMEVLRREQALRLTDEQLEHVARWQAVLPVHSVPCVLSRRWALRDRLFARLRQLILLEHAARVAARDSPAQAAAAPTAAAQPTGAGASSSGAAGAAPAATAPVFFANNAEATREAFAACVELVEIGMQDTVPQLVLSCIQCAQTVVDTYAEEAAVPDTLLRTALSETILPRTIAHVSTGTQSVVQASLDFIMHLAKMKKVGVAYVSAAIMELGVHVTKSGAEPWKLTLARLKILGTMTAEFEFKDGGRGLSTEGVMTYVVSTFRSSNGKVRGAAVDAIIEVYKRLGNVIRVYLKNQKPALLADLKERIAKVARRDRTKSAPLQTLASMVQPLGIDDDHSRPSTFPSALEVEDSIPNPHDTMKAKIQRWKSESATRGSGGAEDGEGEGEPPSSSSPPAEQAAAAAAVAAAEGDESTVARRKGGVLVTDAPAPGASRPSSRRSSGTPLGVCLSQPAASASCLLPPRHGSHTTRLVLG